jgi:hypothetical protein
MGNDLSRRDRGYGKRVTTQIKIPRNDNKYQALDGPDGREHGIRIDIISYT